MIEFSISLFDYNNSLLFIYNLITVNSSVYLFSCPPPTNSICFDYYSGTISIYFFTPTFFLKLKIISFFQFNCFLNISASTITSFRLSSTMAMDIEDLCLFIFAGISVPIYLLVLLTIVLNQQKFNSSFFTLCLSLGIYDLAYIIHEYLFDKASNFGYFAPFFANYGYNGGFLALYATVLEWGFTMGQFTGTLIIAINRFTAIVFSISHEKVWKIEYQTKSTLLILVMDWSTFSDHHWSAISECRHLCCPIDDNAISILSRI